MKVFVVLSAIGRQVQDVVGVYSTYEAAEAAGDAEERDGWLTSCWIEERTLDAEPEP